MPELRSPGVYVQETSAANEEIAAAPTSRAAFLGSAVQGPVNEPVTVRSVTEFTAKFGTSGTLGDAVELFFLNGGTEAVAVRLCDVDKSIVTARSVEKGPASKVVRGMGKPSLAPRGSAAAASGSESAPLDASGSTAVNGGIRSLDGTPFNLLYIPPYRDGRDVEVEVLAKAAEYCLERRAMLLIDAPRGWPDTYAAERGIEGIRNALGNGAMNAAMYFPHIRRRSGPSGALVDLPPGAAVAGVIARTDAQRGVWKAPAGTEAGIRGIEGTVMPLSDTDLDRLNPLAINGIRSIPGLGAVIWGARTLAGASSSEWKYVPVRRLALFIEESLMKGLKWAVFEPNDEKLWARLRLLSEGFLNQLFRQGAFQGRGPKEAYFVKCDRETTTEADVSNGALNLMIGFAPLKPAEFIVMQVRLRA